jgi:hypothetical protein
MRRKVCRTAPGPWRPLTPWSGLPSAPLILVAPLLAIAFLSPVPSAAQDLHFVLPIPDIEEHLRDSPFEILDWRGSRRPDDRTQQVLLGFEDESVLRVKWANAVPGASRFNNEPRYEAAAYEIQKLFLDPDEYVVPPTILRALPLDFVDGELPGTRRTFREAESVLVVLQYWILNVTQDNVWDPERAREDMVYAKHIGNMNVLTYLIHHSDSNVGNFLVSAYNEFPRVFAVDNGVAFRAPESDRGYEWRDIIVERIPSRTIERLRELTLEDFEAALETVAEFEAQEGLLVAVPPGENINRNRGVRLRDGRIQLGLTALEIRQVDRRRQDLIRRVERGQIETF